MTDDWRTYSGVLHVHTEKSGGMPLEKILEAARDSDVDFVVLTDCGISMKEAKELEGWHDGVLVLVGEEVCCPDGHFLAFDTREEIGHATSFEHSLEQVRYQSGSTVGTHYHYRGLRCPKAIPDPLPLPHVDLVEIWSFHDEFVSRARGRMAVQFHARPERLLVGPDRKTVADWDQELRKRMVPAIGSVTALCRKEPLLDWKEYFPFKKSFKTLRTVIRTPELPDRNTAASQMVWNALRRGYGYIANVALGNPTGFEFQYLAADETVYHFGETVTYQRGGYIHVRLPVIREIIIRCNSYPLFWGTGQEFKFPAPTPGVYRVEVNHDRRTWILSNPIRVLAEETVNGRPATVFDFT